MGFAQWHPATIGSLKVVSKSVLFHDHLAYSWTSRLVSRVAGSAPLERTESAINFTASVLPLESSAMEYPEPSIDDQQLLHGL